MGWGGRKYGNKTFTNAEGKWDSKGEWERWCFLKDAEARGEITELRRQVVFELVPKQMGTKIKHLKTKDKVVEYVAENPVTYLADFVYKKVSRKPLPSPLLTLFGEDDPSFTILTTVVEDFKGVRTDKYIIKRKLMRYLKGIAIREVKKPTEQI